MSEPRGHGTAIVLRDGRVLVAGGSTKARFWETASAELFDPATGTWSPAAAMNEARMGHSALAARTMVAVLVFGGTRTNGGAARAAEHGRDLRPCDQRWTRAGATCASVGERPAVTRLRDGRVLAAGGVNDWRSPPASTAWTSRSAELYDPGTDAWTATAPMAEARMRRRRGHLPDGARWWPAVTATSSGSARPDARSRSTEVLDPVSLTWSMISCPQRGARRRLPCWWPTRTARRCSSAGPGPSSNRLHLATGRSKRASSASIPATGVWQDDRAAEQARSNHEALTLADGSLFVFGGTGLLRSAERLVPVAAAGCSRPRPRRRRSRRRRARRRPSAGSASRARCRIACGRAGQARSRSSCAAPVAHAAIDCSCATARRVLARTNIRGRAGTTITAKLKLSASLRRKLRHRKTSVTLVLPGQGLTRWITLSG